MSASPASQAKVQALNMKLETSARSVIDVIEREALRKFARDAYVCQIKCIDDNANNPRTESYEMCSRQCDVPNQQARNTVQHEISTFQNRLNRSLQDCQDRARDAMVPGYENDAKKMQKVEDVLIKCMSSVTDEHIGMLKPMKERIYYQLNQINEAVAKRKNGM